MEPRGDTAREPIPAPPRSLLASNPLRWLAVFGPGAVLASLSIGTGELIFSSRAGALFEERVLWVFLLTTVLKWTLVYSAARHMVLSGAHPVERWLRLPGPPGWFPAALLVLAVPAFPIWIAFHARVIGTLASWLAPGEHHRWGALALAAALALSLRGGYRVLERVQLVVVGAMLACVTAALFVLRPDLVETARGFLSPGTLAYPAWLAETHPKIAATPVWVELLLYVSVIGGSGFDYLAYVSYLRDKGWGHAGQGARTAAELHAVARDRRHPARLWLRAPLVDCTASFAAVLLFSAVFTISAAAALAPRRVVPEDLELLPHQVDFLTALHPGLLPLYAAGAGLTLFGTLYGTLEVAPALARELWAVFRRGPGGKGTPRRLRALTLAWCGGGGFAVLGLSYAASRDVFGSSRAPSPEAMVTPAALFTGVLCCGLISLLNPWMDRRFLPAQLRMPLALVLLNLGAGAAFTALGLKSYWDWGGKVSGGAASGGWIALGALAASFALGGAVALAIGRRGPPGDP